MRKEKLRRKGLFSWHRINGTRGPRWERRNVRLYGERSRTRLGSDKSKNKKEVSAQLAKKKKSRNKSLGS